MSDPALPVLLLTIPCPRVPLTLLGRLLPVIRKIAQLIQQSRTPDNTPTAAFEFENALDGLLRDAGRQPRSLPRRYTQVWTRSMATRTRMLNR